MWFFTRSVGHFVKVPKSCSWLKCTLCREWCLWCKCKAVWSWAPPEASSIRYTDVLLGPLCVFRLVSDPVQEHGPPQPLLERKLLERILLGRPWWSLTGNLGLSDPVLACFSHFTFHSSPGVHCVSAASLLIHFPYPHPNWHDWMLHNYLFLGIAFNHH